MSISTYRRPRISFNCAHFKLPALFKKKKRSSTFSNDKWFQVLAIKQDRWREPICIRCKLKNKEIYYNFLNVKITPCMPSYIYILKCFLLYIFLVSVCLCIRVEEDERIEKKRSLFRQEVCLVLVAFIIYFSISTATHLAI